MRHSASEREREMDIKRKFIMTVLLLGCMVFSGCNRPEELILVKNEEVVDTVAVASEEMECREIAVYVCGQVVNPGVVYLPEDARVVDAVEAAGGLTESADGEYINLAARVSDGEKLYIPDLQESEILRMQEQKLSLGYVNINTADKELLMTLPGIGESKAQDIIDYRTEHGGFSTEEDVMKISGIKESLFEKIKDKIVVE